MKDKTAFITKVKKELDKLEPTIAMYRNMINPMAPDNTIGRVSAMYGINNKSINEVTLYEA